MMVVFEGKFSKKKEDLICDALAFGMSQLFPHDSDVYINIHAIATEGLCGDCFLEDRDINEYTIRLNKKLSPADLTTTVFHELVHVSQHMDDKVMDTKSPYWERWQEIEAHSREVELKEKFDARQ